MGGFPICFLLVMIHPFLVYNIPVPEDCSSEPYRDGEGGGLQLECHLSAINSEAEKTNFSVIPAEHTLSLTVKCGDKSSQSQLEPQGFRSLLWLEELSIKDCNIDRIPDRAFLGLTRLKSLTIKSETNGVLTFTRGSFEGLANLQSLDISENSVRLIEKGVLCSLPNLLFLNLSYSDLGSISDLGMSTAVSQANCLRNVQNLDLKGNKLAAVTSQEMFNFPSVQKIDLSFNLMRHLDEDVFEFTKELVDLDISNNQLSTLLPSIFTSSKLIRLSVANNSITSLPAQVFANQENLQYLDLSGNILTSSEIKPNLFAGLSHLMELDLSQNQVDKLRKKIFWELTSLESLSMSNNKIREIPNKLFKSQSNLKTLKLSKNLLTQLTNEALLGIELLNHLMLDNNLLEEIDEQVFTNLSSLSLLDLSNNNLLTVPKSLRFLRNLKSIDLSKNFISDLEGIPLPQLWRLNLSKNKIGNVSATALKELISLQILDLSNNKIEEVQRGAFDFTKLIRAVRLDGNYLDRMDSLFHQLPNLTWLNISDNRIEVFDYAMVPRNLLWLDIHKNQIQSLENYFGIDDGTTVQHIDAGFNRITNIGPLNVPKSVEILLLNDNDIIEVAPYTFFEKSKLKKVDLTVNKMSAIDRNSLRISTELFNQPKFFLGGNPMECDCEMVWFKTINDKNAIQNLPFIADLESIYCKLPYSREQTFAPLVDASPLDFLCSYKTHCFALCHCCDYDACDCEMACPDQCSCYHDNTWTKNIAECSSSNFTDLPVKLPMDATEIFLDGNNIGKLKSHTFIGRKNLRVLYLNNSNIELVQNNTFNGLPAMTILHLENNQISKLEGDEFQGLSNLRELYLQDNMISHINNVTFKILQNLEVLFLHGNRIIEYPVWSLSTNPYLISVQLAGNLWSCDCAYVHRFMSWLDKYRTKVYDAEVLTCITNDVDQPVIRFLGHNASSCQETREVTSSHIQTEIVNDYLPLLVATLVTFTIIIVTALVLFLYRNEMRVWLHYKYGVRFFQRVDNEVDQEKIFDAFVAYSATDDMFVRQVLAPELELGSSQYRLCLYHRDLPALHYVADAIVQASEASRRTVVVLSESLLKQEWGRYDFRSGLHQALRTAGKRLIIVLLGDLMGRDLDAELRLYLKTATVIQWGDAKFWQKLKFCLPDSTVYALSQSTTLQSYPSSAQYNSPELYRPISPRYQATPRQSEHIYQVCA